MKENSLSFGVRIPVTRTDIDWLKAVLSAESERSFQEGICIPLGKVEGVAASNAWRRSLAGHRPINPVGW